MCAMHVHPRDQAEEVKTREVADTSCAYTAKRQLKRQSHGNWQMLHA